MLPGRHRNSERGHQAVARVPAARRPDEAVANVPSLVGLGQVALEPVDEPGLRGAEQEPVGPGLLQRDEELANAANRFVVKFIPPLEFGLERELAAQWMMRAPLAPDRDVRNGTDLLAEVQDAEILKYLLEVEWFRTARMTLAFQIGR